MVKENREGNHQVQVSGHPRYPSVSLGWLESFGVNEKAIRSYERGPPFYLTRCNLLHFDGGASFFQLFDHIVGFIFGHTLFHCSWNRIHQSLGLLQT